MKKGVCPKCGSKEIYSGVSISGKSGLNNCNTIPITAFTSAVLDNFVCGNCGYVESYVAKEKDLGRIKKKWSVVF